jgi:hypothetical protein
MGLFISIKMEPVIPNTRKARVRNLLSLPPYFFFPGKYFFSTDATTT